MHRLVGVLLGHPKQLFRSIVPTNEELAQFPTVGGPKSVRDRSLLFVLPSNKQTWPRLRWPPPHDHISIKESLNQLDGTTDEWLARAGSYHPGNCFNGRTKQLQESTLFPTVILNKFLSNQVTSYRRGNNGVKRFIVGSIATRLKDSIPLGKEALKIEHCAMGNVRRVDWPVAPYLHSAIPAFDWRHPIRLKRRMVFYQHSEQWDYCGSTRFYCGI